MSNHIAEFALTGLVIATLKIENPEHVLLTWCAFGGVLSGYVGSMIFPVRGINLHSRWAMSVICAVVAAPILTNLIYPSVKEHAPLVTQNQLAIAVSGLCAVFGVAALKLCGPYIKPLLFALLPPFISRLITPDDNKKDG